jgi:hypothetical protein
VQPGRVLSPGVVRVGRVDLALDGGPIAAGTEVQWCIRPEDVQLSEAGAYRATVTDAAVLGTVVEYIVSLDMPVPNFAPGRRVLRASLPARPAASTSPPRR